MSADARAGGSAPALTDPEVLRRRAQGALAVALDQSELADALALVRLLRDHCGWFKIGLELYTAHGPRAVEAVAAAGGQVFLDLKLHDIPETVERATRMAARCGATLLTVHAAGGAEMLRRASAAARESGRLRLLAVTVLTSLDAAALAEDGISGTLEEVVLRRGRLALAAGTAGLVASPREVAALRAALPAATFLVTPGVRSATIAGDDQRRTATAREAIAAGADLLVIGRPIREAADPAAAATAILAEIAAGMQLRGVA